MEKEALQSSNRPRFSEVCQRYHLDYQAMQAIADRACVRKSVVDAMSVSVAVRRRHAIQVLAALSKYTGDTWTLDNVQIALLHTFQELHAFHQFDLSVLSITSGISFDTIPMMLRGDTVRACEARPILQAASRQTRISYTFKNVDVQLTDGDEMD